MTTATKIIALEENRRWKFATVRKDGSLNRSLRTWASKASALRAGKREYRQ